MSRARFFLLLLTPPVFLLVIVSAASGQTKAVEHFIYLPAIFHPLPNVENISPPLLIDGEAGLLYASAAIDGVEQTVVLATHDGSFVDTFPYAGRLALDRNHHWLMIDQGDAGVVFLDSFSGQLLGIQDLPDPGPLLANPQMDPDSGRAYAFRGHDVYTIDVQLQELVDAQTLFVPYESCGLPQGPATIYDSYYDLISDTFFLSFLTYTCTPITPLPFTPMIRLPGTIGASKARPTITRLYPLPEAYTECLFPPSWERTAIGPSAGPGPGIRRPAAAIW